VLMLMKEAVLAGESALDKNARVALGSFRSV